MTFRGGKSSVESASVGRYRRGVLFCKRRKGAARTTAAPREKCPGDLAIPCAGLIEASRRRCERPMHGRTRSSCTSERASRAARVAPARRTFTPKCQGCNRVHSREPPSRPRDNGGPRASGELLFCHASRSIHLDDARDKSAGLNARHERCNETPL